MIVSRWTGTEVRALRTAALRLTQEEFADVAGYVPATIRKWERATTHRPIVGKSAQVLDTILTRLETPQLERFTSALTPPDGRQPQAQPATTHGHAAFDDGSHTAFGLYSWEVGDAVKRREFGKLAAVGATAAFLGTGGEHVGMSDVRRLLQGVAALEQEDQRIGGGALVDFAVEQLAKAKHRLDICAYDTPTGNAFTSAVGELAVQTGWLAYDSARHPLARRCYADALALGTEADDRDLIAHACLSAATQLISLSRIGSGSPYHALKLIDRSRDLMRGRPPGRIHALVAVRDAQAYAMLADRPAFERAIATAWRELDYATTYEALADCPQWLRFVTRLEIVGHEARGWADLGEFDRSVALFEGATGGDGGARNDANLRAWSAATRARMGDLHGALGEALPVVVDLAEVSSARTLRVLEPVRVATTHLAVADDFGRQFDLLSRKAITA
ncbi:helix-turn-helix domain-containing protein [Nocardia yamanashiensis]|uniref:helix-turn-helix domain-containing protein n=1 Tax=Nocardia yamanashiensis TaxID=209247 RepID=UPI000834239A|nr:helix-turn-helix domain-containing protein [Nocardia yamanashiensis]